MGNGGSTMDQSPVKGHEGVKSPSRRAGGGARQEGVSMKSNPSRGVGEKSQSRQRNGTDDDDESPRKMSQPSLSGTENTVDDTTTTVTITETSTNAAGGDSFLRRGDDDDTATIDRRRNRYDSLYQEERIKINMAMGDLMSYLEIVASHSSNLPLTRRDDPEIGRTVSTLTAEEYGEKSEAFVPSDFRILSGSFTKYGKVWDLPTSEEYNPVDGAQEPGRSHGGAVCNSLLKVLYDGDTSPDNEVIQLDVTPSKLFQGDSQSTDEGNNCQASGGLPSMYTASFASLDLGNIASPCVTSWAELLRKLQGEMQNVGYAQVPFITTSRKLDLEQPFAIVPPDFDPETNKRRSLFIGCLYKDIADAHLKASHDDVRSMQDYIINIHGFSKEKGLMNVLLDDGYHTPPTYLNIVEALKKLSEESQPGDAVFVHFSGHGCRVMDSPIDDEVDAYDEAIIPQDFELFGILRDTLIFKTLIAPMRKGVTVTCMLDACDTGVRVDLPYCWSPDIEKSEEAPMMVLNDDFSFVRFLKVVKTLYDGSTFTQLGRTVKTALSSKSPRTSRYDDDDTAEEEDDDELCSFDEGSLVTADKVVDDIKENSSFFANLMACTTPSNAAIPNNMTDISDLDSVRSSGGRKRRVSTPRRGGDSNGVPLPTVIQHMLKCQMPMLSDDESLTRNRNSRRYDTDGDDTDGYVTDDGAFSYQESPQRQASPRRRKRRERKE